MPRDPNREPVQAVGLASLLYDGTEGTDAERHVVFVDLDAKTCLDRPRDFRADLARVAERFGITRWHLFETQKGVHVVAFELLPRQDAERVEEALEAWGGDGFHRFMGYVNGGSVLRITAKRGEGAGPRYLGSIAGVREPRVAWSGAHVDFFASLLADRGERLAHAGAPLWRRDGELRLEAYETTQAVAPPAPRSVLA